MTDLYYQVAIMVALSIFTYTAWASSEGYLFWNEAIGCLLLITAGIITIFRAWHGDINQKRGKHK